MYIARLMRALSQGQAHAGIVLKSPPKHACWVNAAKQTCAAQVLLWLVQCVLCAESTPDGSHHTHGSNHVHLACDQLIQFMTYSWRVELSVKTG